MEKEDYSNAELNLKNAIDQYSQNSLYYRDYAITLAKQGRVQEAESVLEQATALHLGEDSIYMVQGEIAFAKGDQKAAQEYLLRAVSAAEDDQLRKRAVLLCDRIYRELGTAYIDQEIGLLEQEENRFGGAASAMNLSERLADAYARKAEADESVRQEYYEKALERFEYLYENGYSTRQMMENIAILYEQMDQYNEAEDMLMQNARIVRVISNNRNAYALERAGAAGIDACCVSPKEYADRAMELYDDQGQDQEMQMLKQMLVDLADGGWL
jgi:serine/threonine-protein kinase